MQIIKVIYTDGAATTGETGAQMQWKDEPRNWIVCQRPEPHSLRTIAWVEAEADTIKSEWKVNKTQIYNKVNSFTKHIIKKIMKLTALTSRRH